MSSQENKMIVRRYLEEVWGHGQIGLLRELMGPDIVDHDLWPGQPCGLEGQEWGLHQYMDGVSNVKMVVDCMVAEGDRVADHWTFSATHTGTMMGMPATGRQFTMTGTDEYRLAGGKIVEMWHREDVLVMLQQLGLAPTPPLPESFGRRGAAGGGNGGDTSSGSLSAGEEKERIREAFRRIIDENDPSSTAEYIAPDFVGHYSAFPPVYGRDGFDEFMSIYRKALSNRHTEIEDILVDGDLRAVRATYHSTNTGSLLGMPPSGKSIANKTLMILRMAGDKVAEQWANNDDMGIMQQMGAMPETAAPEMAPC